MSERTISEPEGILLEILHEVSPLSWRRFQQRFPEQWVRDHWEIGSESIKPPYIAFRFKDESAEFIAKLVALVTNYRGKVQWDMSPHKRINLPGTNWIIWPLLASNIEEIANKKRMSAGEYIAKSDPKFASIAFDDFNDLTKYIEDNIEAWQHQKNSSPSTD